MVYLNTLQPEQIKQLLRMRTIGLDMLQSQLTSLPPEGWSVLDMDWEPLWHVFAPLRLRAGYTLRAYVYRSGRESQSRVWAMPADTPIPPPNDDEDTWEIAPPQALPSVMHGTEGDGTPWSYLAASLLARELKEFAALGHAAGWREQAIVIDEQIDAGQSDEATEIQHDPPALCSVHEEPLSEIEWRWRIPTPTHYSPQVIQDSQGVTVRFYTYSGMGEHTLTWHTDQFEKDLYLFHTTTSTIATSSGGYLI